METMTITINYDKKIKPKQSFRSITPFKTKNGKMMYGFQSKDIVEQTKLIKLSTNEVLKHEGNNWDINLIGEETYIIAEITIFVKIPKSISKKKRVDYENGKKLPTKRPDVDNLTKGIFDSHNGLLFPDDSIITDLIIRKRYAEEDGASFTYTAYNLKNNENL